MKQRQRTALERQTAYLAVIASDKTSPEARDAFARLIRLWHPRLMRFAQSRVPDMAEDVVQDAVLTMARNIGRLRTPERFGSWAFTIVARRAADGQRAAIRRRNLQDQIEVDDINSPLSETVIDLKRALAALPETDRRLLTLFHVQGLSLADLSAMLGVPTGTIKSRLHKARARLRDQLDPPTHLKE